MGLLGEGLDLRDADLIVGTSAGASVGTQITGAAPPEQRDARQLEPSSEQAAAFDAEAMGRTCAAIMHEGGPDLTALRQRTGRLTLNASGVPEAERRAVFASRLPNPEWPAQRLVIEAADVETAGHVSLTRTRA